MARILPLAGDAHQQAQLQMPWYVNGTLEPAERAVLQAHLDRCPRCQADAAWQFRLHAQAGGMAGDVIQPDAAALEAGWSRLQRAVSAPPPDAVPAASAPAPARGSGWRAALARARAGWLSVRVAAQVLVMAQAVVIAVLATALWWAPGATGEAYRVLGQTPQAPAANALVVFRADATEAQIRRVLQSCDARIVGGPTATDAYLLAVPGLGPSTLARLRAERAVLRIESLEGEAAR